MNYMIKVDINITETDTVSQVKPLRGYQIHISAENEEEFENVFKKVSDTLEKIINK